MSRSYGDYLLLGGLLKNVPATNNSLYNYSQFVLKPRVTIIENDCGTLLGDVKPIDDEILGTVELSTDTIIDTARLEELKTLGYKTVSIRTLPTCVSEGGVCQQCYEATYGVGTANAVGARQIVDPGTTDSFFAYIAKSYSGSLLGIQALPTDPLPVRKGVFDVIIDGNHLSLLTKHLRALKNIPADYLEYCDNIEDKLERALFIICLYGIYSNASSS